MKRTFFIAGVQFRPRPVIEAATKLMEVGDILTLTPEPTNKFDPNAIRIEYNTESWRALYGAPVFLGYVPKKFSSEVSALLSIGAPIYCVVEQINIGAKSYELIKVVVQTPDEELRDSERLPDELENDNYEGESL